MDDKYQLALQQLWNSLDTPILVIVGTEKGASFLQVINGQRYHLACREVENNVWLYSTEAKHLLLVNDQIPLEQGWRYLVLDVQRQRDLYLRFLAKEDDRCPHCQHPMRDCHGVLYCPSCGYPED